MAVCAQLLQEVRSRLAALECVRGAMGRITAEMRPIFKERLETRLKKVMGRSVPDPDRLVQEVALALDKSDVSEEMTRLRAHLGALRQLLRSAQAVGKRIDFLLQEILREVNTTGAKANHLPLTQLVLEAKAEIEKLSQPPPTRWTHGPQHLFDLGKEAAGGTTPYNMKDARDTWYSKQRRAVEEDGKVNTGGYVLSSTAVGDNLKHYSAWEKPEFARQPHGFHVGNFH